MTFIYNLTWSQVGQIFMYTFKLFLLGLCIDVLCDLYKGVKKLFELGKKHREEMDFYDY